MRPWFVEDVLSLINALYIKSFCWVATRKLNNNEPIFICSRQCAPSMQIKWNKSLLFVSDITGSEMKKRIDIFSVPVMSLVLCFMWAWPWTVYKTSKFHREIMAMSSTRLYQFQPGWPRSDLSAGLPTVLPEDSGNLSYSPHVILIDSSTKIMSLELSVKLCQAKRHFKVHFFATIS